MRIILLLALLLLTLSTPSTAQHEADNWFFGDYNSLSFQSGAPILTQGGQLNTREGVAAMSDKSTGALLFYTDGVTVWNSQHQVMNGGTQLRGGGSSTQSALIVPHPTNNKQYYIFTVSESESGENALCYSIVDMAQGEVITKNTQIITGVSEKLTGTLDCDGQGYWIVTHHVSNSEFYSFHITSQGVSTGPVVSRHLANNTDFRAGYMKISPNRTKIALASQITTGYLALATFNPLTGEITNYSTISAGGNTCPLYTYGIAFSPDNTKLYATGIFSSIFQYEINLPNTVAIRNSQAILNITGGALQLAPDGKIYIAQENTRFLGRIDLPNLKGDASMYKQDVIALPRLSMLGLPNCLDHIFNQAGQGFSRCSFTSATIKPDSGCMGQPLMFTDLSVNATKRTWTFNGATPATSSDSIVSVTYPAAGKYVVRLVVENALGVDTAYADAVVFPNPIATAGSDKTVCPGASARLGASSVAGEKYAWVPTTALDDPTSADPIASPTSTTQYILTVTNAHGCIARDTVLVTIGNIVATVSNDTSVCSGTPVQLTASGGTKYEWSPSLGLSDSTAQNPIATLVQTMTYKVHVSSGTCIDSASVTITVKPQPVANAGQDQSFCAGNSVQLGEASTAGNSYSWRPSLGLNSTTDAQPFASPAVSTEYILTVTGVGGCTAIDTVMIIVGNLKASCSADTTICSGSNVQLLASGGTGYEWFPKEGLNDAFIRNPIASPLLSTTYKVLVTTGVCADSAFTTIIIDSLSIANAGGDHNICQGEEALIGSAPIAGNLYQWSPLDGSVKDPNSAQTLVNPLSSTIYTVQVITPTGCTTSDQVTVNVFQKFTHPFTLTPDMVVILPGAPFRTTLHIPSGVSSWEIRLKYDSLVAEYQGFAPPTNAIQINQVQEKNGELTLHGTGENGEMDLNFKAFLPHTSDTVFAMNLTIDTAQTAQCDRATGQGTKLMLDAYCAKSFRMVSGTGKQYYLTVKDKRIDFGVGLSGNVRLELFDYVGNSVLVVSDGALEAGEYSAALDLPVGVYYCRMRAGMYESVGKVLIAR